MEIDEGIDTISPIGFLWYLRKGLKVACKIYKEKGEAICAYCKRHGKANCLAGLKAASPL
jgi:hypothetical protein